MDAPGAVAVTLLQKTWLWSAYVLFPILVLEIVTGFGLIPETRAYVFTATGGLLDRGTSRDVHILLTAPLAVAFVVHAFLSFRLRLARLKRPSVNWVLALAGSLLLGTFLFLYARIFAGAPAGG